jgi:hypothetical protein
MGEALFYLFVFIAVVVLAPSGFIAARLLGGRRAIETMLWYAEEEERGSRRVSEVPATVVPTMARGDRVVASGWFRTAGEAMVGELARR